MKKFQPTSDLDFDIELYRAMKPYLGERAQREFVARLAEHYPYGSQEYISKQCCLNTDTIEKGRRELKENSHLPSGRQRKSGGGRKPITEKYPGIDDDIREIIDDSTYGSPIKPLSWTTKSLDKIKTDLHDDYGIDVSVMTVSARLDTMGYSRQQNQKMLQVGTESPNRDKQFQQINSTCEEFLNAGDPVISVDTKKKENLGNFKNNGTEYLPKKMPREVLDHDFLDKTLGKVNPYGIYLLNDNTGFINLGTDHDTSDFATESIYRWWMSVGRHTFPNAKRLYINCDGGGSNGSRCHLWKYDLAKLAEKTGLEIWVSHFPPGTSKWNKVEHRLFCYISKSWQGKPLLDIPTVVELIGSTTTKAGLKVKCVVDYSEYKTGIKVSDEDMARIDITQFGNETGWNYIIKGFKQD